MRRLIFLAISLCGLLTVWPVLPLLAQTTVITAGGGSGGTPSFPLLAPNGTAAAPSYSFSAATGTGIQRESSTGQMSFNHSGTQVAALSGSGWVVGVSNQYMFTGAGGPNGTVDTGLARAAAGVSKATLGGANDGWIQNAAGDQFLTADHTNATATPTNLTDLTTTVTSGRKYVCDLNLMVSQSVAADGVRVDFEGGTATATNFRANVTILDGLTYDTHTSVTALATDVTSTDIGTTVKIEAHGLSFEPSGTGTFIPRVGLEAASTGTVTTFRGSSLFCNDTP